MNGMNRVVLMGHLGADPKSGTTPSGKKVTNFRIATNEFIKEVDGEKIKRTDWHKVSTWGKTAEACERMLRKGSMVLVEGKIRNIINTNGEKPSRPSYEIFATDVSFISNFGENTKKDEKPEDKK